MEDGDARVDLCPKGRRRSINVSHIIWMEVVWRAVFQMGLRYIIAMKRYTVKFPINYCVFTDLTIKTYIQSVKRYHFDLIQNYLRK